MKRIGLDSRMLLTLLVGVGMLAGCVQPVTPTNPTVLVPVDTCSIYQLAGRLDMTIERTNGNQALLRNGVNSLLINARPQAVYLNGKELPTTANVYDIEGVLFVHQSIVDDVTPRLRPDMVEPEPDMKPITRLRGTVVIDAGHGDHDPGAIGVGGLREKEINLIVARKIAVILESQDVRVIMTRSDDTFVELEERAAIANRARADLFVSIHCDSAATRTAEGFTIFVSRTPSPKCRRLGNALAAQLEAADLTTSRGVKEEDFRALVHTVAPAALVELGFISNRQEAAALARPLYQDRLAKAIAAGIVSQLPLMVESGD
jgi:N-acetylmuramoyl-L-alanine amidase